MNEIIDQLIMDSNSDNNRIRTISNLSDEGLNSLRIALENHSEINIHLDIRHCISLVQNELTNRGISFS